MDEPVQVGVHGVFFDCDDICGTVADPKARGGRLKPGG